MSEDNTTPIRIQGSQVGLVDAPPPEIAAQMEESSLSRRTFLKASGLAASALLVSGCQGEAKHVIPTVREEKGIKPGLHYWYASTCAGCSAACGITAKVRDGRPIKLEGNEQHPNSLGGLCAKGQGSILGLYDADRLRAPQEGASAISWSALYEKMVAALKKNEGKAVRLLTSTQHGPSMQRAIAVFLKRWPNAKALVYDAIGRDALLDANHESFGQRALASYSFDQAEVILSFGADFLGTWISPVEFSKAWAKGRQLEGSSRGINRTIMLESGMSLTGSNADQRFRILPSQRGAILRALYQRLAKRAGEKVESLESPEGIDPAALDVIVSELWAKRGKSLVVIDTQSKAEALVVNGVNQLLGNYGKTLSMARPSFIAQGKLADLEGLVKEMEADQVGVLITLGVNPVYDAPQGERFAKAMAKVGTSLVLTDRRDESAEHATLMGPLDHFLEGWNDHQAQAGVYSLTQPMTQRLFTTEAGGRVLLALAESPWAARHWRAWIRDTWRKDVLGLGDPSWEKCLEAGVLDKRRSADEPAFKAASITATLLKAIGGGSAESGKFELVGFETVAIGDGRHANNPWLQELPDPLTKATWDNFAIVSPAELKNLKAKEGDFVELSNGTQSITLPLLAQPGQADGCVSVAFGYGRSGAGRLAKSLPEGVDAIGANVFPLMPKAGEAFAKSVGLSLTGKSSIVARSQTHDSQEGRPHGCETTLAAYMSARDSGTPHKHPQLSMWDPLDHKKGHYWGMSVDLNACTGCSGCIVSCQAENNIPVVGREEVANRRDMAWLRLDRYYSDEEAADDLSKVDENPSVMHQPMMCQHCDHAPCETVCPVAATTHSEEGLNQQTYNRCVGTRYCANNCPTKVRRFNWFDYDHSDETMNLVLNPDVTIRSRGIMEKCSMCVQRIYDAKLDAAKAGRPLKDGDLKTACQQSCPTNAIVVGDMNDPESEVSKMHKSQRSYEVLGELNLQAGVRYMTRVRNHGKA